MKKFLGSFLNVILLVILTISLTVCVNSFIQIHSGVKQPMLFGWGLATVETGSMEPNVPVGSLIVIHEKEDYEVGDVVTYIDYRGWSITHRVTNIDGDNFTVKGDANKLSDPVFNRVAIIGKMEYMFPNVGKVVRVLRSPVVIIILMCAFVLSFLLDWVRLLNNKPRVKTTIAQQKVDEKKNK